jgi:hypothetical protein
MMIILAKQNGGAREWTNLGVVASAALFSMKCQIIFYMRPTVTAPNVADSVGQPFLPLADFPKINFKSNLDRTGSNIFGRPKLQTWHSAIRVVPACLLKNH